MTDDHATRITAAEENIQGKQNSSYNFYVGKSELNFILLLVVHVNLSGTGGGNYIVQGLQVTDNSHDARITALEESGGGGSQNGIRKTSSLTKKSSISAFLFILRKWEDVNILME